jgi:hypothetical protein
MSVTGRFLPRPFWVEGGHFAWQPALMFTLTAALLLTAVHAGAEADAVRAFVQRELGTSRYKRADADLNGDGRTESLIYLTDPKYCGSGGCTLIILSPSKNRYRVVMRSTVTQLPIRLLSTSSHGWRDIGVTVAGGGIARSYEVRLRFNGRRYPGNPTVPPAVPLHESIGRVLIGP